MLCDPPFTILSDRYSIEHTIVVDWRDNWRFLKCQFVFISRTIGRTVTNSANNLQLFSEDKRVWNSDFSSIYARYRGIFGAVNDQFWIQAMYVRSIRTVHKRVMRSLVLIQLISKHGQIHSFQRFDSKSRFTNEWSISWLKK